VGMAGQLALFLCRGECGRFESSKVGQRPTTKLHPHLIALVLYIATEVEQQNATEQIEEGQSNREQEVDWLW